MQSRRQLCSGTHLTAAGQGRRVPSPASTHSASQCTAATGDMGCVTHRHQRAAAAPLTSPGQETRPAQAGARAAPPASWPPARPRVGAGRLGLETDSAPSSSCCEGGLDRAYLLLLAADTEAWPDPGSCETTSYAAELVATSNATESSPLLHIAGACAASRLLAAGLKLPGAGPSPSCPT